jgi:hypothetical protein
MGVTLLAVLLALLPTPARGAWATDSGNSRQYKAPAPAPGSTTGVVFQTSFTGPEWRQSSGTDPDPSPQIGRNGDWGAQFNGGTGDQITLAANRPGSPGRGFRHWVGDGTNRNGGGIRITWPAASEIWLRFYVRLEKGFAWTNAVNMKMLYVNQGQSNGFYFGLHGKAIGGVIGGTKIHHAPVSWTDWMKGPVSDGQWHALEIHCKMNSSPSSSDGVWEFWLNGKLIYSAANVQWSTTAGDKFSEAQVGSNQADPLNGRDVYVDYDDIVVSTGRIGP